MKCLLLHFIVFMPMLYASTAARPCLSQRVSLAFHQRSPTIRAHRRTALALGYPYQRKAFAAYSCPPKRQSFGFRLYSASSTQNVEESRARRRSADDEEPSEASSTTSSSNSSTAKTSHSIHRYHEPSPKKKAAQHELDHRIRHKGIVEASQLLAEKFVEAVERPVGKKLAEHTSERLVERSAERAAERAGEHAIGQRILKEGLARAAGERVGENVAGRIGERGIIERLGERTVERVGERAGERVGERVVERGGERLIKEAGEAAVKGSEKLVKSAGEKLSERLAESTAERLSEQAGERFAEQTAERVTERLADQIGTKVSGERLSEHLATRTTERLTEEAGERLAERIGSKAVKPAAERLVERAEQSILKREINGLSQWMKRSLDYIFARKSASHAVERSVESTVERIGERSMGQAGQMTGATVAGGGRIIARRLGRGTLIAIPALGGLFVLHILRQDLARCRLEWQAGQGLVRYCWAGAVFADGMDVFAHGMIVYSLLILQTHHIPFAFEQLSLGCAITSTVCAVVGELFSKAKHIDKTLSTRVKGEDTDPQ